MEQHHRSDEPHDEPIEPNHDAEHQAFDALTSSLRMERAWRESFAVDPEAQAELLRSRWQAEVRVRIPSFTHDAQAVVEEARAALHGREPLVAAEKGSVWALFLVANASDENRQLVERFTNQLVSRLDGESSSVVLSTITRFDTTDVDGLLPEDMHERQVEP